MRSNGVREPGSTDARAAASGAAGKRDYVRAMFSSIAPRYDLLNRVLSLSIDRSWRRRAIDLLDVHAAPGGLYLDLCAGTLDVASELARRNGFSGRIVAADFAEPMLRAGAAKIESEPVAPVVADALRLPLADGTCAGAIVAFGMRNLENLDAGIREVARVLQPGARFVILDFTTPKNPVVRTLYHGYFHHVLPRIGAAVSGDGGAYRYLPESVAHFPPAEKLALLMNAAGFEAVTFEHVTLGIAAIHAGTRSSEPAA